MMAESGQTLLHYRLLEKIGEGGMGVVWKAHDSRLRRDVALKLLAPELVASDVHRHRFLREARAAAAINHPNIAAVYEIGEAEGRLFIAMELVKGRTLRAHARGKGLPIQEALSIGCQVAEGLAHAHRAGVVHRDLKPENVMIGSDGHIRLLDFGLAKVVEPDDTPADTISGLSTISEEMTLQGKVFGTASYMSPEQARGMPVDARSDTFSFGATLYEVITGRLAFRGETSLDTLTAVIQTDPPPPSSINPETPAELDRIVRKCLQKDPGLRYQDTRDLLVDLRQLKRDTDSQPLPQVGLPRGGAGRAVPAWLSKWAVLGIALVLLIGAIVIVSRRFHVVPRRANAGITERLLTTNTVEDPVWHAMISPDGRYLAYFEQSGIVLKVLTTGETKTIDPVAGQGRFYPVGWYPDGTRLAGVVHREGESPSLWALSIVTGALQKIRDHASGPAMGVAVSPDGRTIAFVPDDDSGAVWLMDADGSNPRKVISPQAQDETVTWWVRWSPDSHRIVYRRATRFPDGVRNSIETCDLMGGSRTVVLPPSIHIYPGLHAVWPSDGQIVFSRTESMDRPKDSSLWAIDVDPGTGKPLGEPRRLMTTVSFYSYWLTATATGDVALVRWRNQLETFLSTLQPNGKSRLATRRVTMEALDDSPQGWMRDGRSLILSSNRRGTSDIYSLDTGTGGVTPLVAGPAQEETATLSPDGQWILYTLSPYAMNLASLAPIKLMRRQIGGGSPEEVLTLSREDEFQCATRTGGRCALAQSDKERTQLFDLDPVKGKGSSLADISPPPFSWSLSPDGHRIAWSLAGEADSIRLVILDLGTGHRREAFLRQRKQIGPLAWSARGDCLYAAGLSGEAVVLLRIALDGQTTEIPQGDEGFNLGSRLIPSPDGRSFAFSKELREGAVWLLGNL